MEKHNNNTRQRQIRQTTKPGRFKRYRNQVSRRHFQLPYDLMMSELGPLLGPDGLAIYCLLGNKKIGKMPHDERLCISPEETKKWMSRPIFYKMLFRLRAYRLILPTKWGRRGRATEYKLIKKWRTLISMPDRLERICNFIEEREALLKDRSNPKNSHRRQKLQTLQDKIFNITI